MCNGPEKKKCLGRFLRKWNIREASILELHNVKKYILFYVAMHLILGLVAVLNHVVNDSHHIKNLQFYCFLVSTQCLEKNLLT